MFTLASSVFDHFQFTLIQGPNISGSYAIFFFTALDFTFTTRHLHIWALFPLWFSLFISSGAVSPLFSSIILGTHRPGEFIFQCHIFLPFHTVHGVVKARILKWFAILFCIPFSSRQSCRPPEMSYILVLRTHGCVTVHSITRCG